MPAMKTALVTGAAGFIGSHVTRALLADGWNVRALDNLSGPGDWHRLDGLDEGLSRVVASVVDDDDGALDTVTSGVDCVFHLAARVSVPESVERPLEYDDACSRGTLTVLEAARRNGVPRFVYASSSACYGDDPRQPKTEAMLPAPVSPYAVAKYAGELYVRAYASLHGMRTVALRYFNVFGPGQNPRSQYGAAVPSIVTTMIRGDRPTLYGDGGQTRDFCHVDNVVAANLLAASADVRGEALNIGTGRRTSVNDIVARTNELLGTSIDPIHADPRPGDVRDSLADVSLANEVIGYEPTVQFDDGLAQSVAWYREHLA